MPIIKRYPNRKLYDTNARQYISLEGIAALIRLGEEIQVIDNTNGEDLTAVTLTQVIFEEEKKHSSLLPQSLFAGLIRASGDRLNAIQRNFVSSIGFIHQVDEEIRQRVAALITRGELSEDQGASLLDKLLAFAAPLPLDETVDLEQTVSQVIAELGYPTRTDLQQMIAELDALEEKLDRLNR